ncbi:hypothetical protein ACP_2199 [Acidobacterium capsulatum ATCC 51196]|uniref:Uncharacterized protein n=1 Tax=Acidobacterium capsulatum (strain ATCC 51196 / DSM 11244 / BCRC 80197 / JCM 7670 / NBRC 15755 / NCIMB 13165 / 161) TaxID=240015 RepID=C1F9P0_ACIC5|nr:hypothetical protein ACP_2199 [Acidobacterium capsulatum ATCC 51196]
MKWLRCAQWQLRQIAAGAAQPAPDKHRAHIMVTDDAASSR